MRITTKHLRKAVRNPFWVLRRLVYAVFGFYYTWRYVDRGSGRVRVRINPLRLEIRKGRDSTIILDGVLNITPFRHGRGRVRIILDADSTLEVCGDFSIGNGTEIFLWEGAYLRIGGKDRESGSGITENSRVMVKKRVTIGKDFVCAWGVLITDCDWHQIENVDSQSDVAVGDHVWITPNGSILKGTQIGDGCIVSNSTVISGKQFPDGCLIGGNPPAVLKSDVRWHRDIGPDGS